MAIERETELYAPIKAHFARLGYEVKAEVRGCDLVAVRPADSRLVIVEMKKTFTLPLLLQGLERQRTGAEVWLAVERNRTKKGAHNQRFHELSSLCGRLKLGFMTVTFYKTKSPVIEIWRQPQGGGGSAAPALAMPMLADHLTDGLAAAEAASAGEYRLKEGGRAKRGAKKLLQEFEARSGDYNVGGSSKRKLVTAYRERSIQCALALECGGPASPKRVRELTGCPNAASMLRDNYYGWFRRVERGVYELTPAGSAGLAQFPEVTRTWTERFAWAANRAEPIETGGGAGND
ncbi:DUF2161 family putative PD-(D/E)XK-type phosphodiesterase [Cohnella fermenti]|uniref:Uncharacterized protein n=1 Tax=Cohnella fermenti TaxID=2565925 RepID=A0A4S4BFT3_9BACL|nr:DUF2161 family putative PD-(D/E)XK-type phosphodiesterase [Cohnella fermenti]THF73097.1 hypothetical protein E6C55_30725 [Cohnella fermenti]